MSTQLEFIHSWVTMVHWWPLDQSNPKDVLEIACITRTVVCNVTWTFFILFSNCEILIFFELWLSDPIVPLILAKQSQYNFWLPLAGTYSTVFWYSLEICISPPHLPNSPIQSLYCSALWNNLPNPEGRVLETLEEVWNSGVQEIFLFFPDLRFFFKCEVLWLNSKLMISLHTHTSSNQKT